MKITLSQAIEGYGLAARARRLSVQTLAEYGNTFTKFRRYLPDDHPVDEISVDQIRAFLAAQDSVAAKTLLNYHTGLSALWRWAAKEGLVNRNIVRDIDPPRPERKAIEPYSQEDVKAMLQELGHSHSYKRKRDRNKMTHSLSAAVVVRNRAILLTLLDTGLRASELCGLRAGDLNLRNRKLKVMGKGAKERILPFSANTGTALWRYLASKGKERKAPGRPLFTTAHDQPMTRVNLYHIIQRIGSRAGITGATVHRFRHTYAIQ